MARGRARVVRALCAGVLRTSFVPCTKMAASPGIARAARLPALAAFSYSILRCTLIVAVGLPDL